MNRPSGSIDISDGTEPRGPGVSRADRVFGRGERAPSSGESEWSEGQITDSVTPIPAIDVSAERRQLTVMMCDLVNSTALAAQLDPEDLHQLIGACLKCVSDVVTGHGGVVSRFTGDGALAYFGYPTAHEDDVERAIRASLRVVEALRRLTLSEGRTPRIRIGIATGLVVVSDTGRTGRPTTDQDVVGAAPNLAARLQALAGPDEVVIASSTYRLSRGLFDCRDLGAVTLKGFDEPVRVWRVVGPRAVESRFDAQHETGMSRLVGREEELTLLLRRWQQVQGGSGRGVLILGESGIGKSRLKRALQEQLAGQQYQTMGLYCSPHHSDSAFYPVISRIEQWAGFANEDTADQKLAKLEAFVGQTTKDPEQVALVAELLSLPTMQCPGLSELSPEQRKEKTMEALLAPLVVLAARRPLLILFEDLHWIDPSTLELLALLLERLACLRALLVITARPDFLPPWPSYAHMTTITLSRLNRSEAMELAEVVAGGRQLPEAVLEQILGRTEGVPLFVEELTKAVIESGVVREHAGAYVLQGALPDAAIPVTLHDSLMARLDRIGGLREIAQVGAAIGREFSAAVLREVSGISATKIEEGLARLVQAQLLSRRGDTPDVSYAFRHTLIRDAAYSTLLRGRRQDLHARIAAVLEQRFPRLTEQQPELIAHHCTEAGFIEKAIGYLGKAGRRSAARHAKIEAVVHFRRALALLASLPRTRERQRQELQLESALGRALIAARIGAAETGESYRRARKLCEELGDAATLAQVLGGLAMFHLGRCELDLARRASEDLLDLAEKHNDASARLAGHVFRGVCLFWVGELVPAKAELERAIEFAIPEAEQSSAAVAAWDMQIGARCFLSLALLVLGRMDEALSHSRAAVAKSRALRPPQILARELTYAGLFNMLARAGPEALTLADEAIAVATDRRYPFWLEVACIIRGAALADRGQVAEGLQIAREAVAERERTGSIGGQTYFLGLLSLLYEKANRLDESWDVLRAALDLIEKTGERWFEPELHRMRGEFLLAHRTNSGGEAEACLHQALALARERGAKLWELRAATGLSRLWFRQGKRRDAHELLQSIVGAFDTEFDMLDLADARSLLGALACPDETDIAAQAKIHDKRNQAVCSGTTRPLR